jgi:hypothetical protein
MKKPNAIPSSSPVSSPPNPKPPSHPERITRKNAEQNSRLFAFAIARFLHSAEHARRQQYGNDIDLAIIAETIALGAIEPKMRDPEFRARYGNLRDIVGTAGQRAVNALSVAAATGIPRETTRRKIKQLIAMGVIAEKVPGNYVIQPGYLQSERSLKTLAELESAFLRLLNDCRNETLFEWPAARADKPVPAGLADGRPDDRKVDGEPSLAFAV